MASKKFHNNQIEVSAGSESNIYGPNCMTEHVASLRNADEKKHMYVDDAS